MTLNELVARYGGECVVLIEGDDGRPLQVKEVDRSIVLHAGSSTRCVLLVPEREDD